MINMSNWGNRIQTLLNEKGIKQKELAKKINVTPSNISQLVGNSYPPIEKIEQICSALNIKLWEFFYEADTEMPDYVRLGLSEIDLEILKKIKKLPFEKQEKFWEMLNNCLDFLL